MTKLYEKKNGVERLADYNDVDGDKWRHPWWLGYQRSFHESHLIMISLVHTSTPPFSLFAYSYKNIQLIINYTQ